MLQNLEITSKIPHVNTAKTYIAQVLDQLLFIYQQTQSERRQIALWEEDQAFSILGILEMLTDDIRGYSLQIISNENLDDFQEIPIHLKNIRMFEIPHFSEWYFSLKSDYPHIKNYIETLNYLRLLAIEYLLEN